MTKRLIILLSFLVLVLIYFFLNDNSEKSKMTSSKKLSDSQSEESFLINSINISKVEIEEKQIKSISIPLPTTPILDLKKEEKMIEESIEEYEYMVENNLLLNDYDMDDDIPIAIIDKNENRVYDDEDEFIDADSKELDASIDVYNDNKI